jgi:hypothetical protein
MLTSRGLAWLAGWVAGELEGGSLFVGDNDQQSATKPIENIEVSVDDDGVHLVTLTATFGEPEANFDWNVRGVVLADGTDIDRKVVDQGRKAEGSVWTLEIVLQFDGRT